MNRRKAGAWVCVAFAVLFILLLLAMCSHTAGQPAEATPTMTCQWRALQAAPAESTGCWEQEGSDLLRPDWRNAAIFTTAIPTGRLVADGDWLWVATDRGLAHVNLCTWECALFASPAQAPWAETSLLLPDGDGGLWVGMGSDNQDGSKEKIFCIFLIKSGRVWPLREYGECSLRWQSAGRMNCVCERY